MAERRWEDICICLLLLRHAREAADASQRAQLRAWVKNKGKHTKSGQNRTNQWLGSNRLNINIYYCIHRCTYNICMFSHKLHEEMTGSETSRWKKKAERFFGGNYKLRAVGPQGWGTDTAANRFSRQIMAANDDHQMMRLIR
jgi:hypothetical protein